MHSRGTPMPMPQPCPSRPQLRAAIGQVKRCVHAWLAGRHRPRAADLWPRTDTGHLRRGDPERHLARARPMASLSSASQVGNIASQACLAVVSRVALLAKATAARENDWCGVARCTAHQTASLRFWRRNKTSRYLQVSLRMCAWPRRQIRRFSEAQHSFQQHTGHPPARPLGHDQDRQDR